MYNEAIAELRALIKAPPTGPVPDKVIEAEMEASSSLGYAYGMAGRTAEAQDILGKLRALSQRRYISGIYFAIIYAGLKDNDRTIHYLNEAFQSRQPGLVLIRIDPTFEALRNDERFKQLTQQFEPIP
jgi:tetratricopeptide (TPR) repeat protein